MQAQVVRRDREAAPGPACTAPATPRLAVVIPALDEEGLIGAAVAGAFESGADEVLVVDGGSADRTREIAAAAGARVARAPRGRALQMNAGARYTDAHILLFLHADSRLPARAGDAVRALLADPDVGGGAFRMRIDHPGLWYRLATGLAQARAAWWGIALGDQAIFARREIFAALGGFRDLPLLEDLDFVDRLRRRAAFRVLRPEVRTSPRRWERHGRLQTSIRNWLILLLYRNGLSPRRLASLYR